jgi:hypothetical protein
MVGRADVAQVGRTPTHAGRDLAGGRRHEKARRSAAGPCGSEAPCARRCTQARVPTADLQLEASGQDWGRPPGASLSRSPKRAATPRSARSLLWHTPMLSRPRSDFPARRHGRQGAGRVRKRTGSDAPGARDDPARAHVVPSHHGGRRAGGRARLRASAPRWSSSTRLVSSGSSARAGDQPLVCPDVVELPDSEKVPVQNAAPGVADRLATAFPRARPA